MNTATRTLIVIALALAGARRVAAQSSFLDSPDSQHVAFPDAKLVKAFNSVGNSLMVNPAFAGAKPTMFYCGNDAKAKADTARIIEQFGWEPADMGTARAARAIEPLCQLWCIPGFRENKWADHAFHLLRR